MNLLTLYDNMFKGEEFACISTCRGKTHRLLSGSRWPEFEDELEIKKIESTALDLRYLESQLDSEDAKKALHESSGFRIIFSSIYRGRKGLLKERDIILLRPILEKFSQRKGLLLSIFHTKGGYFLHFNSKQDATEKN